MTRKQPELGWEPMLEALKDLLALYDEERGVIDVSPEHTCPECTLGTVPNHLNKGPCAFHRARAVLAKETASRGNVEFVQNIMAHFERKS